MTVAKMKNKQKGQALIELIIFLPIMFMLYSLISGFANAINGSINQQKVTRAYFYYRAQNNSTIPKPDVGRIFINWSKFGMFFIGWKEYFSSGDLPMLPCYKVSIPMKATATDKCEEKYTKTTSQYIRVGTVYGMCGATFERQAAGIVYSPDYSGGSYRAVVDPSACFIK
jgi:hypothetical protein